MISALFLFQCKIFGEDLCNHYVLMELDPDI